MEAKLKEELKNYCKAFDQVLIRLDTSLLMNDLALYEKRLDELIERAKQCKERLVEAKKES